MTNRELLQTPAEALGALDKLRLFLLRAEQEPVPCPACKAPVNAIAAAGVDLDAYDSAAHHAYRCPACGAELEQALPQFLLGDPPWCWELKDSWLRERLHKAAAFDRQQQAGAATKPA